MYLGGLRVISTRRTAANDLLSRRRRKGSRSLPKPIHGRELLRTIMTTSSVIDDHESAPLPPWAQLASNESLHLTPPPVGKTEAAAGEQGVRESSAIEETTASSGGVISREDSESEEEEEEDPIAIAPTGDEDDDTGNHDLDSDAIVRTEEGGEDEGDPKVYVGELKEPSSQGAEGGIEGEEATTESTTQQESVGSESPDDVIESEQEQLEVQEAEINDNDDNFTTSEEERGKDSDEEWEDVLTEDKLVDGMTNVDVSSESNSTYHALHPNKGGGLERTSSTVQSHTIGTAVSLSLVTFFLLCACCIMRYRRNNQPTRGKYSVLHGSDDFFNGTFSDDVSIREKDSDEEFDDVYSYDSDDDIQGKGGTRLEMGMIHEADANGGLTLDECNG